MATQASRPVTDPEGGRFASILVPLDGSPESEQAIDCARQFRPDEIVLLRVEAEEPPETFEATDAYAVWQQDHIGTVASDLARTAEANASAAGSVRTQIRYGNPANQIIAEALDHDLVVMTSSGRSAAGRFLFGSVADRVMRHGVTPTVIVRAGQDGASHGPAERLFVPLDGSEIAERALPIASRAAVAMSLPVHLVRCVGMDEVLHTVRDLRAAGDPQLMGAGQDPYNLARVRTEDMAVEYLEALRQRFTDQGVEATTELLQGSAAFELLWSVTPSDLIVMTSRGRGGYERWMLGSVAEKMVREAKAPVMLVPVGRSIDREGSS